MAEVSETFVLMENPKENRQEVLQVSKPVVRVFCFGNNDFKCSMLPSDSSEERYSELPFRISIHHAMDLDLFARFTDPVHTQEVVQLIGQREQLGEGMDIFLILIGMNFTFSQPMFDLLTSIPNILEFKEENKQSFWERAVIAFNAFGHSTPEDDIQMSINGNIGVRRLCEMVGGRYTYLSTAEPNVFMDRLVEHCHSLIASNTDKGWSGWSGLRDVQPIHGSVNLLAKSTTTRLGRFLKYSLIDCVSFARWAAVTVGIRKENKARYIYYGVFLTLHLLKIISDIFCGESYMEKIFTCKGYSVR